jgi:hypothetical protein
VVGFTTHTFASDNAVFTRDVQRDVQRSTHRNPARRTKRGRETQRHERQETQMSAPLALPQLLSHLDSPCFRVVNLGSHEDLRLGLFGDPDSEESGDYTYLLDWLGLRD